MIIGKPRRAAGAVTAFAITVTLFAFSAPAFAADTPSPSPSVSDTTSPSAPVGTAPNTVQNIQWTKTGTTSVKLSWSAPAVDATHDAATYYVVQTSANGQALDQGKKVYGTSTTYKNVDPGTVLTTTVTAVNAYGASQPQAGPKWTQPATMPDAPDSVTITDVGATSLKVSWTAPPDDGGASISSYDVKLYKNSALYYSQSLSGDSFSDSFTGLPQGATYRVDVVAVNKAGQSEAASSRDVKLAAATPSSSASASTSTPASSAPVTVASPSPSDTKLQQEMQQMQAKQAAMQAQQQTVLNWVIGSLLVLLLIAAIVALILVVRYNRQVDAYNDAHGFPRKPRS